MAHTFSKKVVIKDSTLREGLDVPGVNFSFEQKLKIARCLDDAQVPEMEVVAPAHVLRDLEFVKRWKQEKSKIKTSGLIYAYNPQCREEIEEASRYLDRFDLLMSVSTKRKPYEKSTKVNHLLEVLSFSLNHLPETGVGFPNSTQTDIDFLLEMSEKSMRGGARRITIYDTNGKSNPFEIYQLIKRLKDHLSIPLFFHGHNDLGMATANSLAAINAGADGLDVTVNGLGDRAGNTSLEQVVLNLYLKGLDTGIPLQSLKPLSREIEQESGIEVSKLAPIVGQYIFHHESAGHLECPELFEAFDPNLIDSSRILSKKEEESS